MIWSLSKNDYLLVQIWTRPSACSHKIYFYSNTSSTNLPHNSGSTDLILFKVLVAWKHTCAYIGTVHVLQARVSVTWLHIFHPRSQKHVCTQTQVPAAITYFAVNLCTLPLWSLWSSSSAGQRQEVSWEKRRKQKQLSLAAGSDPEPWPSTSTCISLTTQTDKTQMCKCGSQCFMFPS